MRTDAVVECWWLAYCHEQRFRVFSLFIPLLNPSSSVHLLRKDRFRNSPQYHGSRLQLQVQIPVRHHFLQRLSSLPSSSRRRSGQATRDQDHGPFVRRSRISALPFDLLSRFQADNYAVRLFNVFGQYPTRSDRRISGNSGFGLFGYGNSSGSGKHRFDDVQKRLCRCIDSRDENHLRFESAERRTSEKVS